MKLNKLFTPALVLINRFVCRIAAAMPENRQRYALKWLLPASLLAIVCWLLPVSCSRNPNNNSTPGKATPETETGKTNLPATFTATLTVGSGGGFTGATVRYVIPPDGKVTRIRTKVPQDTTFIKQLTTKELTALQQDAQRLRLNQMTFNFPGNLYYFITYADKDLTNTITWGDRSNPAPPDVQDYYNRVMTLVIGEE
ncbi:hypothetical protein C7N43_05490 [Sphingobacteriales bacterium UPWRP_1]|nr:hypothetical protein BVG80_06365 [Sphingobacteriales bacterium TSM_CSM]PSJ78032.1 hypothetical protein C7N43_05490 [Sphingobacteriales bacterium UPWRP_1]